MCSKPPTSSIYIYIYIIRSCLTAAVFPLDACSTPGIWLPVRWSHWPPPDTCNNSPTHPTHPVFPHLPTAFPSNFWRESLYATKKTLKNTTWVQDFHRRKQWDLLDLVECWQLSREQMLIIRSSKHQECAERRRRNKWGLDLADKRGNAPCQ